MNSRDGFDERCYIYFEKYFSELNEKDRRENPPKRLSQPFNRAEWWDGREVTKRWGDPYNFSKLWDAIRHKGLPMYAACKAGKETGEQLYWVLDKERSLDTFYESSLPDFKDAPYPNIREVAQKLLEIPHWPLGWFLFHMDDVTWVEKRYPELKGKSRAYWLTHTELMERWKINAYVLQDTIGRLEVPAYQMGMDEVVQVTLGQWITLSSVMIKLSDAQAFEEKHEIIDNKRLTGRLLDRLRCIDFAWKMHDDAPNVYQHEVIKQIRDETSWGDGHKNDTIKRWIEEVPLDRRPGRPKRKP